MTIKDQIETAKAAGYTYAEIGDFLKRNHPQVKTALDAGYTIDQVLGHFGVDATMPKPFGQDDHKNIWDGVDSTLNAVTLNQAGPTIKAGAQAAKETLQRIEDRIGKEKGLIELTPEDRKAIVGIIGQFPQLYDYAKTVYNNAAGRFAQENPGTQMGAEVVGSTAPAMLGSGVVMGGLRALGGANAVSTPVRAMQTIPRFLSGGSGYARTGEALPNMLGARIASQAAAGAGEGGLQTLITHPLTPDEPIEDQLKSGTALGAIIGGTLGPSFNRMGNAMRGPAADFETAKLAQYALDNGINLRPGQISNSPIRRGLDSAVEVLPFSGRAAENAGQMSAFTRNLAKTFGEDADNLSAKVIDRAETRIGRVLDDAAARTEIQLDSTLVNDLADIQHYFRTQATLQPEEYAKVEKQIDNILNQALAGGSRLSGKEYQTLTNKGSPLANLINSGNVDLHWAGRKIRTALDDALERASPAEAKAAISEARGQWKNLKTLEAIANKNQPSGVVSPKQMSSLLAQVNKRNPDILARSETDIGKLAQIGDNFIKAEPGAELANQNMLRNGLLGLTGVGAVATGTQYAMHHPGLTALAGLTTAGSGPLLARLNNIPGSTQRVIDRTLRPEGRGLPLLLRAATAGGSEYIDQERERGR